MGPLSQLMHMALSDGRKYVLFLTIPRDRLGWTVEMGDPKKRLHRS